MAQNYSCSRNDATWPAPFMDDPRCQKIRDSIDYSRKITMEMALNDTAGRPVRVYADGIYDMFHSGHARQFMQVKQYFPNCYLIVGVCNDEKTHRLKGKTVMNEEERYDALRHCRYVDEVHYDAPWFAYKEFMEEYKIDFVAHDDIPYTGVGCDDIYGWFKETGRFVPTQRTEGISTTDIISRIIQDYDVYLQRNMSRGYSMNDLKVGFLQEKKMQPHGTYWVFAKRWEDRLREFVGNFMRMFSLDGRITTWWSAQKQRMVRAISLT